MMVIRENVPWILGELSTMSNEIPRYFYANRQEYHSFTDMYLYLDKPLWTEGTTNQEDSPTQSEIHIYGAFLVDEIVVAALTNS